MAVHAELARMGAGSDVDWSRVVLWWGDERFVAADSDDRNARQAMPAFGDRLAFDPAKVHEVPSTADASSVDEAAAAYSAQLREHGAGSFEVLMLGMGPDGHVASLFPGSPQLDVDDQVAVGVTGSPKPPPERVSLTFAALNRSRSVWFLVSGEEKAGAVARALAPGTDLHEIPAAGVTGELETIWFLDRAQRLPALARVGTSAPRNRAESARLLRQSCTESARLLRRADASPGIHTATDVPTRCSGAGRSRQAQRLWASHSGERLAFLDAHLSAARSMTPFTYAQARASGVSGRRFSPNSCKLAPAPSTRSRVCTSSSQLGDSVELRAQALRLVVPEDAVVCDRHAGWLHGAEMVLAPNEHLELRPISVFRPSGMGRVAQRLWPIAGNAT